MTSYLSVARVFQPAWRTPRKGFAGWILAAIAAQNLARRYRRDLADLRRMDPALLHDMGLTSSDIDRVTPAWVGLHTELIAEMRGSASRGHLTAA
jgi:uncharacterized protein YjiS (DUF1127 family)